jgi:L-lactate dehydrogenase complex protein LldF
VKIDIPKVLLKLRAEVTASGAKGKRERTAFRIWAWVMGKPRLFALFGSLAAHFSPRPKNGAWIRRLSWPMNPPPLQAWLSQRDLPAPAERSFRSQWKSRKAAR